MFSTILFSLLVSACQDSSVYVSDLTPSKPIISGWGPPEMNRSNGEQGAADGHSITIKGKVYAKGIGTHALSSIHYALSGKFTTFTSDIGVDDEVLPVSNCPGTVNFKVNLDGKSVYDSGVVKKGDAAKSIQINVIGVQDLELAVSDGGDGINCDHADWANAQLISSSIVPVVNTASASVPAPNPTPAPTPTPTPAPVPSSSYGADLTIPSGYSSQVCLIGDDDASPGPKSSSMPLTVLKAGTYAPRDFSNGCFVADQVGKVIFDGGGKPGKVNISNAIVRGIVVQNVINNGLQSAGAVVIVNSNSKLVDSLVTHNQSLGISFPASGVTSLPSNVSVIRSVSEWNGYMGFGGGILHGLIKNSISRFNNHGYDNPPWKSTDPNGAAKFTTRTADPVKKWYIAPAWEAGGGKIVFSNDLLVDHMTVNDNGGPGLWTDVYDLGVTFQNIETFNNFGIAGETWAGQGLTTELTYGPMKFLNNYAHDNEGSEIAVMETFRATVQGNKIGKHGIEIRNGCHKGDPGPSADSALLMNKEWHTAGLLISGNTFVNGGKVGYDGGVCDSSLNNDQANDAKYGNVIQNNVFN